MLCGIYKLPNISIRYTGTWKDSLKFGVGMAATAAGIILALLGGGSVDLYLKLTRDLRGKLIHPRGQ